MRSHFKASESKQIPAEEAVRSAWGRTPRGAPGDSSGERSRGRARARAHRCDQKWDCYARILEPFVDQTDGIPVIISLDVLLRVIAAVLDGHNVSIVRNIGVESDSTTGCDPDYRGESQI